LLASIASGRLVSRWGRYKVFPVVGTFLMVVGLFLLSRISLTIGGLTIAGYLFVFGVGLGLVLQILGVRSASLRVRELPRALAQSTLGEEPTSGAALFRVVSRPVTGTRVAAAA
jgi:hypothetical protein